MACRPDPHRWKPMARVSPSLNSESLEPIHAHPGHSQAEHHAALSTPEERLLSDQRKWPPEEGRSVTQLLFFTAFFNHLAADNHSI